jgi:transposase
MQGVVGLRFPNFGGVGVKGVSFAEENPMARKSYTREFKLQALRMITGEGLSIAEAARRLGIGENLLRNWKKAAAKLGADAFPGNGNLLPAEDERRKLRAEVIRPRAERDLLKTAAADFANPPS